MEAIVNLVAFVPFVLLGTFVGQTLTRPLSTEFLNGRFREGVFVVALIATVYLSYAFMNCTLFVDLPFANPYCSALGW